ncbi:MAG: hypothetical protein M3036_11100, partial [Bifidobacteriales bacterium]|nr:hypothetical protein [Bifidobacteriales bacterium]
MSHPAAPFITPLPWQPPAAFFPLCRTTEHSVFLDSGGPATQDRHRWSLLCPRPVAHLTLPLAEIHQFPQTLRQFLT